MVGDFSTNLEFYPKCAPHGRSVNAQPETRMFEGILVKLVLFTMSCLQGFGFSQCHVSSNDARHSQPDWGQVH